jgi:hypothetical protein
LGSAGLEAAVSRRLANGMYILLMVAFNQLFLLALWFLRFSITAVVGDKLLEAPLILQSIGYNQLGIFLLVRMHFAPTILSLGRPTF